jgi:hypothetical protein
LIYKLLPYSTTWFVIAISSDEIVCGCDENLFHELPFCLPSYACHEIFWACDENLHPKLPF